MKINQLACILALCYSSLTPSAISAEIIEITLYWNAGKCDDGCAELLEEKFQKMRQVESVNINPNAGMVTLKWGEKSRFTYHDVKTTMQMVGVGVNDVRVRVRGKAQKSGSKVVLNSLQDRTRFQLVSPIQPDPGQYTTLPNPYFRELSPELTDRILQEAKEDKILVIEGSLFQPARSPPLQLVVERIQIERKK